MKISHIKLFALALEDYVCRYQNRQLLDKINKAYQDQADAMEQKRLCETSRNRLKVRFSLPWDGEGVVREFFVELYFLDAELGEECSYRHLEFF